MPQESYSVSQTARLLGISPPTVRRMAAEGELESFRTPGGHLRITRESIEAARNGSKGKRDTGGPSPVLRNRRERVEELALEAQELRAQRDIEKLRREQHEEQAELEAEVEAQERQADREAEAARLRLERVRIQQEREHERREAERDFHAFRDRWLDQAEKALAESRFSWLSHAQRREVLSICEAEIGNRQMTDAPRMAAIIEQTISATVEPWDHEKQAKEARDRMTRVALWSLPAGTTDRERAQATRLIQQAIEELPASATDVELRAAAEEATECLRQGIERREIADRALWQLPWSATEAERNNLRREFLKALAELPPDVSEAEARQELQGLVDEACEEIEERKARAERKRRKPQLVGQGIKEIFPYLLELKRDGEISDDELWDSGLRRDLEQAVREELQEELSGEENAEEVEQLVHEIVDEELRPYFT